MINKIKLFYNENKIWMQLSKYISISILLAILVILIDTRTIAILDYIPNILLTSVSLAKEILGTLTGSLLTITTFTFSTIMVVLTMYSSEFSPRVVSNFLTDKITLKVLGVFIGGFVYCILTLFFMKNTFSEYLVISATIAVLYSFFCIIYFVIFVYYVSSSIQASKLINRLYYESSDIIEQTLKHRSNFKGLDDYHIGNFEFEFNLLAKKSGYLDFIESKEILKTLKDFESKFILHVNIGDFISKNQKIATIYCNDNLKDKDLEDGILTNKLLNSFIIENERIAENDYRFSLQKIIDITLRALSPGINDPNTAIHCINILSVLLAKLSKIEGNYRLIKDENSKSLIIYEDFNFKEDLYFTFYQIIHYGKEDISIIIALFNALKTIKLSSSLENYKIIKDFTKYIYQNSINNFKHEFDLEFIEITQKSI